MVREPVLLRARNRAGPAAPCLKGEHDILAHRQVADDAGGLAVLGAEAELLPDCGTRRGKIDGPAIDLGRTAIGAMGAEEDFGGFRPPRAEQACHADNLAGADIEIEGVDLSAAAKVSETVAWLTRDRVGMGGMDLCRQFPTDHHCDQLAPVEIGHVARADQLPVPQTVMRSEMA